MQINATSKRSEKEDESSKGIGGSSLGNERINGYNVRTRLVPRDKKTTILNRCFEFVRVDDRLPNGLSGNSGVVFPDLFVRIDEDALESRFGVVGWRNDHERAHTPCFRK